MFDEIPFKFDYMIYSFNFTFQVGFFMCSEFFFFKFLGNMSPISLNLRTPRPINSGCFKLNYEPSPMNCSHSNHLAVSCLAK